MNELEFENDKLEITKDNLVEKINKNLKEVEKLWNISDKDWKKLPNEDKELVYKKEKELYSEISNMIISILPNTDSFSIGKFGNLESKQLDLTLNIHSENFEIERGVFKTQEYKYHNIEFKQKDFEKNLFKFFEKDINWYKNNNGINL